MNEVEAARQQWIYDQQGLLIVLGPLEVITRMGSDKITYTFKRSILWRRSGGDSEDKPPESGQDSGNPPPESN